MRQIKKSVVAVFRPRGYRPGLLAKRSIAWSLLAGFLGILCLPAIVAATALISQSYTASSGIAPGSLVSLQKNSTDHVDAATSANVMNLLGAVINDDNAQVSIAADQNNQVLVATSGVEQVLVSDVNGKISEGDSITASPLAGIGMKATDSSKVIGVSQGTFPNNTASKQSYKDKAGTHDVMLGQIPVQINVAYYYKTAPKTLIPSAIQNLANALAGKPVDALPILISIGIFVVTLIVVVSIIYAMIHSSIISVGRNPMSQAAIYRNVIQLSALVVVILIVAVVSIYMVLTKF
jgi:hypothetical protein